MELFYKAVRTVMGELFKGFNFVHLINLKCEQGG